MPRRTQTTTTRPRWAVNFATREPARRECGCRLDRVWLCPIHFRPNEGASHDRT